MHESTLILSIFLIFAGASLLSTLAIFTRQSLLVAYMLLGVVLGPWGLALVSNGNMVKNIGHVGIIFLLFLLGLHLPPQKLLKTLKEISWVALVTSAIFLAIGYAVAWLIGLPPMSCWIVGAAMMFSSTIIGIKLLPTTVLHHQHTGEVMIGILLLQDLIAIAVLLLMHGAINSAHGGLLLDDIKLIAIGLPATLAFAFLFERYVLRFLFAKFNKIKEYNFLLAIAWCLGMSELSIKLGLSAEIGAFIGGVSLAACPISLYIAESLKPLRDFFLVMFFFSIGAEFDLHYLSVVIIPAACLAALLLLIKPLTYRLFLGLMGEKRQTGWEVGFRLGQVSEFSLIIAGVAVSGHLISNTAVYLVQATTILTFVASSYYIVSRYPTPVALSDKLRRE